jgi:RNA polymerase sigma-70 factor (ECF subfamily)
MDETALVRAAMQGDTAAFGQIVATYRRLLVASARYAVGRSEDAEDMAQEAFIRAYRRLPMLREPTHFRPWLFTILRNVCLTHRQRRAPETLPLEEYADIPATPEALEAGHITAVLEQLSPAYREVLVARYLQELSYADIARMLGGTPQGIRMRCARARKMVRELLQQQDEEETRRLLRHAMAILPLGSPSLFSHRILQEVTSMSQQQPDPPAHPSALTDTATMTSAKAALHLVRWKTIAWATIACVLGLTTVFWGTSWLRATHARQLSPSTARTAAEVQQVENNGRYILTLLQQKRYAEVQQMVGPQLDSPHPLKMQQNWEEATSPSNYGPLQSIRKITSVRACIGGYAPIDDISVDCAFQRARKGHITIYLDLSGKIRGFGPGVGLDNVKPDPKHDGQFIFIPDSD